MNRTKLAALVCGGILLQIQGVSCLGIPASPAPIFAAGDVFTAIQNFLAGLGLAA